MNDRQMQNATAEELAAAENERRREESWERSDTDGFLSQWAAGINARLYDTQADINEGGGTHEFLALFDAETDEMVPARMINTRYGTAWGVFVNWEGHDDEYGGIITWVNVAHTKRQRANQLKKGFKQGWVKKRAKAKILGGGRGLSGAANAYVGIVPVDRTERGEFVRWDEEER